MKLTRFNIGFCRCYTSNPAAAATAPLQECEDTTAAKQPQKSVAKKPDRKARFTSKMSSILHMRKSKQERRRRSDATDDNESLDLDDEDDRKNAQRRYSNSSIVSVVSAAQLTKLVEDGYFGISEDQINSIPIPLLLDADDEECGPDHNNEDQVVEDCHVLEEVGLIAHEYLEECFYTEESVLDREKFNAITEVVKSDVMTTGHLGKGSFSDVFEVVCKGGQIATEMSNTASGGTESKRRRSAIDMRSSRSSMPLIKDNMSTSVPSRLGLERQSSLAMKCLRPQIESDADHFTIGAEDLVHETAILANLNHQHIIKLHGRASGNLTDAFALNDGYFILIDKLNETLQDRIKIWKSDPRCFGKGPTAQQIEVACSVADALSHLHYKKIVFRDLKPANVGFDHMGVVKLFDFGFATSMPEHQEDNPSGLLFEWCGTPRYMAPEVGLSLGYGMEVDVYSFGILLWELCALAKPFSSLTSLGEFKRDVFSGGKRPVIEGHWPTDIKELIRSCWAGIPSERPAMLDVKFALTSALFNAASEEKAPRRRSLDLPKRILPDT